MAENRNIRTHRDDGKDAEGCECGDRRRKQVDELLGLARPHVFLEEQLHGVGNCLEQAEGTGDIRAGTSLHASDRSTFNPQCEQNVEDQENNDENGLEDC